MLQKLKNIYHGFQAFIANMRYGFPARKLKIIGVTGTDGKTTTTSMIYHVLKTNGLKVGMISTLHAKMDGQTIDTGLHVTTPEPWDLPRILRTMLDNQIEYVIIESTSSGLDQNRLLGITYDASTITNIGHDHIDYHKTWENYATAKFKIAKKTKPGGLIVLNKDHESAKWLESHSNTIKNRKIEWYTQSELKNPVHSVDGIEFEYLNQKYKLPLIGEYNFSNALGVIKICLRYLTPEQIAEALAEFNAPTGRMQIIQTRPFSVIIDFAHTPSSLENALKSIIKIKPKSSSKIFCVFGCAGERDPYRRKMGEISAKLADITIVTLEDPRSENIKDINTEILEHAQKTGAKVSKRFLSHQDFENTDTKTSDIFAKQIFCFDYPEVQNRIDAIQFALNLAQPNDIVFVTGKGHEESLAIGNPPIEYPYTDQKTVSEILKKMQK